MIPIVIQHGHEIQIIPAHWIVIILPGEMIHLRVEVRVVILAIKNVVHNQGAMQVTDEVVQNLLRALLEEVDLMIGDILRHTVQVEEVQHDTVLVEVLIVVTTGVLEEIHIAVEMVGEAHCIDVHHQEVHLENILLLDILGNL